jgi:hypothetical protein
VPSSDPDEGTSHEAFVDAWLRGATEKLPPAAFAVLLERSLDALWRRAQVSLGDVTLGAIVDRVLSVASESYPPVATLKVKEAGVSFDDLSGTIERDAVRFILVELLTVVGNLTDEILTPELHAALSKVALEKPEGESR